MLWIKNKKSWKKREFSKTIVTYSISVLTSVLVWACILKTLSSIFGWGVDLSDVLTYTSAAFGGELVLLAFKRIFAKDKEDSVE